MKILAFAASNSTKSINRQLIGYAGRLLDGGLLPDADVTTIDLNDYEMPIYSVDRQEADGDRATDRARYQRRPNHEQEHDAKQRERGSVGRQPPAEVEERKVDVHRHEAERDAALERDERGPTGSGEPDKKPRGGKEDCDPPTNGGEDGGQRGRHVVVEDERTHQVADVGEDADDQHDLQVQAHPIAQVIDLVRGCGGGHVCGST